MCIGRRLTRNRCIDIGLSLVRRCIMNPTGYFTSIERCSIISACIYVNTSSRFFFISLYRKVCFRMVMSDICISNNTILCSITKYIIGVNGWIKIIFFQIDEMCDSSSFALIIDCNVLSFYIARIIANRVELITNLNDPAFFNFFTILL